MEWYLPDLPAIHAYFSDPANHYASQPGDTAAIWHFTTKPLDLTGVDKSTKRPNWHTAFSIYDLTAYLPSAKAHKDIATHGIGIVPKDHPTLIAIDIDDTIQSPFSFRILPPTYTELSTSKHGLRLLYHISTSTKKLLLDTQTEYVKASKSKARKPIDWSGQVTWGNNYMLLTGFFTQSKPEIITTLKEEQILSFLRNYTNFERGKKETLPSPDEFVFTPTGSGITSWQQFEKMVMALPLDQNYQIQQAVSSITNKEYCHWDYWFTVGSAIHYTSKRFDIPEAKAHILWLRWSSMDPTSFDNKAVEQLDRHWASFEQKYDSLGHEQYLDTEISHAITDATILALYNAAVIRWPVIALKSKHAPDPAATQNALHAFHIHDLKFSFTPSKGLLISGPTPILDDCWGRFLQPNQRFFNYYGPISELAFRTGMTLFGQSWCKLRNTTWLKTWTDAAMSCARSTQFVPMERFLTSLPKDYSDEERQSDHMDEPNAQAYSTFDTLWSAIRLLPGYADPQYVALYKKMLWRALMTMVMTGHPEDFVGNQTAFEGIPVLTGPERTGKTSFWQSLLPKKMKPFTKIQLGGITGDKPERDFGRSMSGNTLVILDEIDSELTVKSSTALKKLLTSGELAYTEIYETMDSSLPRQALLAGTTNSLTMPLGDNGSRRMWIIPIESMDYDVLNSISRYYLFQNLNKEYMELRARNIEPQKMTYDETLLVTECNKQFNATSSNSLALEDIFETPTYSTADPMPMKELEAIASNPNSKGNHVEKHCWTLVEVRELLQQRGLAYGKLSALKQSLCSLSVAYTGRLTANINGRLYKNGHLKAKTERGRTYYILPTLRDNMTAFVEESE